MTLFDAKNPSITSFDAKSPSITSLYEIKNLSVSYGHTYALRDVSLSIKKGGITALIGPNGSGKSTFLKALSGVLPYSGSILFGGREARTMRRRDFGLRVGVVPQGTHISYPFAVYQIIEMGRIPHKGMFSHATPEDDRAVLRAAELLGVSHLMERPVTELSGGETQRVAIAMALAQEADTLILDEPTSALDPRHSMEVFGVLEGFAKQGGSVIAAVHDVNLACTFADSYIGVRDGRAVCNSSEKLDGSVLESLYGTRFEPYTSDTGGRVWHAVH